MFQPRCLPAPFPANRFACEPAPPAAKSFEYIISKDHGKTNLFDCQDPQACHNRVHHSQLDYAFHGFYRLEDAHTREITNDRLYHLTLSLSSVSTWFITGPWTSHSRFISRLIFTVSSPA